MGVYILLVCTGVLVESMSWICRLMGGHIVVCAGNVRLCWSEKCYLGVLGELYIIL